MKKGAGAYDDESTSWSSLVDGRECFLDPPSLPSNNLTAWGIDGQTLNLFLDLSCFLTAFFNPRSLSSLSSLVSLPLPSPSAFLNP